MVISPAQNFRDRISGQSCMITNAAMFRQQSRQRRPALQTADANAKRSVDDDPGLSWGFFD
jgi:hypothetical protein